jgi:hypothetical protein
MLSIRWGARSCVLRCSTAMRRPPWPRCGRWPVRRRAWCSPGGAVAGALRLEAARGAGEWRQGVLGGVATLGLTMFTRWIPVHVAYVAAEARPGQPAEFDFPAERAFPVSVVAGHGLLAATTLTLVLLTMLTG